jgi:hypothetical protein
MAAPTGGLVRLRVRERSEQSPSCESVPDRYQLRFVAVGGLRHPKSRQFSGEGRQAVDVTGTARDAITEPESSSRSSVRQVPIGFVLITAKAAPSGSESTAKRPGGMSIGGTSVVAPAPVALETVASVSFTAK